MSRVCLRWPSPPTTSSSARTTTRTSRASSALSLSALPSCTWVCCPTESPKIAICHQMSTLRRYSHSLSPLIRMTDYFAFFFFFRFRTLRHDDHFPCNVEQCTDPRLTCMYRQVSRRYRSLSEMAQLIADLPYFRFGFLFIIASRAEIHCKTRKEKEQGECGRGSS